MRPSLNLDSFGDLFVQRQRRFIIIVVVAAMISLRSSPFRGSKNASFVLSSRLLEGSQGRERVPSSDLGGQVISISLSLLLIRNNLNVVYNLECSWPTAKARPSTSSTNLLSSSSSSSSSYDLLSHFRSSFTGLLDLTNIK